MIESDVYVEMKRGFLYINGEELNSANIVCVSDIRQIRLEGHGDDTVSVEIILSGTPDTKNISLRLSDDTSAHEVFSRLFDVIGRWPAKEGNHGS